MYFSFAQKPSCATEMRTSRGGGVARDVKGIGTIITSRFFLFFVQDVESIAKAVAETVKTEVLQNVLRALERHKADTQRDIRRVLAEFGLKEKDHV
jgi:hypothetical protein